MKQTSCLKKVHVLFLSLILFVFHLSVEAKNKIILDEYIPTEKIFQSGESIELLVNSLDLERGSESTNRIQFSLDASGLMVKPEYPQLIKIKVYTKDNSDNENIISIINSTIFKLKQAKKYNFSIDIPATFSSNDLFIYVYDSSGEFYASFTQYLEKNATQNLETLEVADCDNAEFGDCQLKYILNSINYLSLPSKKRDVVITKENSGKYTMRLPLTKSKGAKFVNKGAQGVIGEDVNSLNGLSSEQLINLISQDDFGFNQLQLAQKELSSENIPADGTLEFDGENLYLVKSGQREEIGKQGPGGVAGQSGPPGPSGSPGSFSGGDADINGTLTFLSQGSLLNPNIKGVMKLEYSVNPPDAPELGDLYHDSSSAICVFLENKWQKLIGNGNCKPGLLVPKLLDYPALSDLNIDYTVSISPVYNGDLSSSFSISPSLPTGLELDTSTGVISGTPNALSSIQSYTVTVSNALGSLSDTFSLGIYDESLDLSSITISADTLPTASGGGSVEVIGSQVFVIGGHNSSWGGGHTSVQHANTATPTTFINYGVGTLPSPIAWSETAQVADYIYALGSVQGTGNQVLRAYNGDLSSWSSYASLPGPAHLTKVILDDDSVFILGAGANGNLAYRAPIDDLTTWQDLGVINGFTRSMHLFQVNTDLYAVSASSIYKSSTFDITNWVDISAAAPPAEANAGISVLIGSNAYIIGNFMSTNIYSASISDIGTWTLEPQAMPQLTWGMHHGVRIGSTYYIYGGMNSSYLGTTAIFTIPIIKTYI